MGAAIDKLRKARIMLLVNKPFFGTIAMHMPFLQSESAGGMRTTAVDENGRFYYNEEWIQKMSLPDLVFEIAHEVMHVVQQCMTRFPKGGNHATWNLAADYVVDTLLVDAKVAQSEVSKKMVPESIRKKFGNKTTEEVYYALLKEQKNNPAPTSCPICKSGGQQNQGQGQGQQPQQQQSQGTKSNKGNKEEKKQHSAQPKDGDSGPSVPCHHHHPDNARGCTSASTIEKKINAQTLEKFKQYVIAAAQAAKEKGNAPGFVNNFLAEITKPTITWKDKLRNLTASYFKGRYTFRRPNRREGNMKMRLPNRAPKKEGAIIMIDTSGSISDGDINQFVSECVGIMNYCGCPWIKVYLHDVLCYHSEAYSKTSIISLPVTRGGTSHVDVFKKVLDNEDKIGCIIAFTDLYTDFPPEPINVPVIWAHTQSGKDQSVPFGKKVLIELANNRDED